ncbi:unnamed protein product [Protopolystoma xenopodis]|uniref:Uncharacterized protein n=1 Tax=Protopolystoma xenopodis TaxID=117903 RepID=A0A3S5FH14_9PLAT|nr:unnamed protein product [Protopolystoma xenopodis]
MWRPVQPITIGHQPFAVCLCVDFSRISASFAALHTLSPFPILPFPPRAHAVAAFWPIIASDNCSKVHPIVRLTNRPVTFAIFTKGTFRSNQFCKSTPSAHAPHSSYASVWPYRPHLHPPPLRPHRYQVAPADLDLHRPVGALISHSSGLCDETPSTTDARSRDGPKPPRLDGCTTRSSLSTINRIPVLRTALVQTTYPVQTSGACGGKLATRTNVPVCGQGVVSFVVSVTHVDPAQLVCCATTNGRLGRSSDLEPSMTEGAAVRVPLAAGGDIHPGGLMAWPQGPPVYFLAANNGAQM